MSNSRVYRALDTNMHARADSEYLAPPARTTRSLINLLHNRSFRRRSPVSSLQCCLNGRVFDRCVRGDPLSDLPIVGGLSSVLSPVITAIGLPGASTSTAATATSTKATSTVSLTTSSTAACVHIYLARCLSEIYEPLSQNRDKHERNLHIHECHYLCR